MKTEDVSKNLNDYLVIEFNETSDFMEKDYSGELVTGKLLDEIKELDEKIRVHNETVDMET